MQGYENYDLQEVDPCIYKDVKRVVWRLRKGDVRFVFYCGEGKIVFLAEALAKRQNKLTVSEKIQLENEIKTYIDAEQAREICVIQPEVGHVK